MSTRLITDCDQRLQDVWAKVVPIWLIKHPTLKPCLSCCYRSPKEQDAAYAIGRTVVGENPTEKLPMGRTITNAQSFKSPHNFTPSQAFDFFFTENGKAVWTSSLYEEFSEMVLALDSSLVWGGRFKGLVDSDHIETNDWRDRDRSA